VTGPLVTVVVLNYNGATRIPGVLGSLAAQDLPQGQMAVWVVDNASTDGSLQLLTRDFPWVRTIPNPTNDGFAGWRTWPSSRLRAGRQRGLRAQHGRAAVAAVGYHGPAGVRPAVRHGLAGRQAGAPRWRAGWTPAPTWPT
jgi:Glycosyl transferase family 2